MSFARAVLLVVLVTAASACPASNTPQPFAPPETTPPTYVPPGSDAAAATSPTAGADGAACTAASDCASGVCEGQGCAAGQGRCAPKQRACTKDLRQYCGCDRKTFKGSGSCPGARYEFVGACDRRKADGASCLAGAECASGVCEGQGCGNDTPGTCMPAARRCTRDLRPYCGCDGKTFRTSGSCPGQRYAAKGECRTP